MSKYTALFTKEALRQLKKLDQYTAMMMSPGSERIWKAARIPAARQRTDNYP